MKKHCLIVVNAFSEKEASKFHVSRYQAELERAGVCVRVAKNNALAYVGTDGTARIAKEFCGADFWLYLDKDTHAASLAEAAGARLFNGAEAMRLADDKMAAYTHLSGRGILMPKTIAAPLFYGAETPEPDAAEAFLCRVRAEIGLPAVVKECHGSFGRQVYLAEDAAQLEGLFRNLCLKPHLYQRFVATSAGRDMRLIVIGGKFFSAMIRNAAPGNFRTNLELGGTAEAVRLPPEEFVSAAEACAVALGLDYCGVDLLFGGGGKPVVCEVNSNAYFRGMEQTAGVNVAAAYVAHILHSL